MAGEQTPALFLDRDGVIIQNRPDYVLNWAQVEIFPWALEALACLEAIPYRIVIVSNQSAVGRGLVQADVVDVINRLLLERISSAGGRIDAVYYCPHTPSDNCSCRKPRPGLILRAAEEMSLDLSRSIMIGDALEDIEAGRRAGVGVNALVCTGRGEDQLKRSKADRLKPFPVFDRFDLDLVAKLLMKDPRTV